MTGDGNGRALGFGLGLRPDHYQAIRDERPAVDWFEILSENYMVPGGPPLANLESIRADWPVAMHGVSLSIARGETLALVGASLNPSAQILQETQNLHTTARLPRDSAVSEGWQ